MVATDGIMFVMIKVSLMISIAAAAGGVAGCASDDHTGVRAGATTGTNSPTPQSSTAAAVGADPILIEEEVTDARLHTGVVLGTSFLAESTFCVGGTTSGGSAGPAITETFHCPEGSLTVRFSLLQRSLAQGATWEVLSGTGSLKGLRGGGSMVVKFDVDKPDSGRSTFTGTVER